MKETRRQKKCIVGRLGRILSCAILAMAPFTAFAQMTDEAVISYVRDGLAEGKSKESIAKELAARGVTREQAERVNTTLTATYGSSTAVTPSSGITRMRTVDPSKEGGAAAPGTAESNK